MYLELGWLPLRYIMQSRRLNFFKYILNQKETSIVKQVFYEQKVNPLKGDWLKIVEFFFRKLKIDLTHDEITNMSKNGFKKVVKKQVEETGLKFLKGHVK